MKSILLSLAELISWRQTLFALPWLINSCLLIKVTRGNVHLGFVKVMATFGAFFLARTAAMIFNRYLDRHFDGQNPRTKDRALATGRIRSNTALAAAAVCLIGYWLICFSISKRCFDWALCSSPILIGYSLFKRFSWTSHLVLGLAQSLLPIMCGVALRNEVTFEQGLLGLALGSSVAAFDILYALQDLEIDRQLGLFSIPAFFGSKAAVLWSRALHVVSLTSLFYLSVVIQSLSFFTASVVIGSGLSLGHFWLFRKKIEIMRFFVWGNGLIGYIAMIGLIGTLIWAPS